MCVQVSIDPMRLPQGVGDELAMLDELEDFQQQVRGSSSRGTGAAAAAPPGGGGGGSTSSSSTDAWGAGWSSKVSRGRASGAAGRGQQQGAGAGGGRSLEERLRERFGSMGDEGALLDREGMSTYSEEEFRREFGSGTET